MHNSFRAQERLNNIVGQVEGSVKCGRADLTQIERLDDGRIGIVYLNRTEALNALNDALILSLNASLQTLEDDPKCACVILTGRGRAFAAGADIKEMEGSTPLTMLNKDKIAPWEAVLPRMSKPVIAAVNGAAFGGGCEIAMMCDMIVASDAAKFGQPEIKLGLIPGAGGTQRLTKCIGKYRAMQMVLTGEPISAQEAHRIGLVCEVVSGGGLMERVVEIARNVSRHSIPVLKLAKEAVNKSQDLPLTDGLRFERRLFHMGFSLQDSQEGMGAFTQKRKAKFEDK
eukprot:GDKI01048318.1.p1 GENE.GDKI01048318.1~~GDKI01048318.1.p1  ORF type:complete len:285 (-),score=63.62 GDKI01048318.1:200-1054(-)